MLGENYESYEEFRKACKSNRKPLVPIHVLGKVYSSAQLKFIAKKTKIDLDELSSLDDLGSRQGVGRRYNTATRICRVHNDPVQIGEMLARLDHFLFFPVITYLRFPDSANYICLEELLAYLRRNHEHEFNSDFVMNFNGMIEPSGRVCELESTLIDTQANVLSLLFSCTRILVVPDGQYRSLEYYFLARIPVLVRLLFDHSLFEVSMPTFSEVSGASRTATNRVPERYQVIVRSVIGAFLQYLPDEPSGINFQKLTLYLEEVLDAEDMGWKIEPQHEAAFDLKGLVPLKKVLDNFSEGLKAECSRRGIQSHPLANTDLYRIFRALKEQSYTYLLMLEAPIGSRRGGYHISVLYGPENSEYAPVLWIPNNHPSVAESLRNAVDESQSAEIMNPYDLDSLLK